jgi:hypothetical protein
MSKLPGKKYSKGARENPGFPRKIFLKFLVKSRSEKSK